MTPNKKDHKPVQVLLTPTYIKFIARSLNSFSPFLASRFAAYLFLKPYSYNLPKREREMDLASTQKNELVEKINREIRIYKYGNGSKKIIMVHGWSGRGTQMAILAKEIIKYNFTIFSFDAPAHGKLNGSMSMMPFFIEAIKYLDQREGPFYAAIGHSLGGMSLLKAIKGGLTFQKLVIIGTANSITHITKEFSRNLGLDDVVAAKMKQYFDNKFGEEMDNYSGAFSALEVKTRTLVVHDENDVDVHVSSAYEIHSALDNSELFITKNLGHRRILGDAKVINKITTFITV